MQITWSSWKSRLRVSYFGGGLGFFVLNKLPGIANAVNLWATLCVARIYMASFAEEKNLSQSGFRNLNVYRYLGLLCWNIYLTLKMCQDRHRQWGYTDNGTTILPSWFLEGHGEPGHRRRLTQSSQLEPESTLPEVQSVVLQGFLLSCLLYSSLSSSYLLPSLQASCFLQTLWYTPPLERPSQQWLRNVTIIL